MVCDLTFHLDAGYCGNEYLAHRLTVCGDDEKEEEQKVEEEAIFLTSAHCYQCLMAGWKLCPGFYSLESP
jgi:hypothetical protein